MGNKKAWYSTGGALVTDAPIDGITGHELCESGAAFYGKPYLIAESMRESAAQKIAEALGLEYCGKVAHKVDDFGVSEIDLIGGES